MKFDRFVCEGDSVSWESEGFDITARVVYDPSSSPDDCDCFDVNDPEYGEQNRATVAAWKSDEWFYCGIVLSVSRNGITIDKHAASLWGIEANFPGSDNAYLSEVAQELESEALTVARAELSRMVERLTS